MKCGSWPLSTPDVNLVALPSLSATIATMSFKRIFIVLAAVILFVFVVIGGTIVYAAVYDPAAPPAELAKLTVGMSQADVVAILGPPTQRGFPGLADDCFVWESPRGMVIVFLDADERATRLSWVPAHKSELRQFWRYLAGE